MSEHTENTYSSDVITTYVWDAIKDIPGVVDLHRSPLQALGEKVHLERRGPVRLAEAETGSTLNVHIVIGPEASVPAIAEAVRRETTAYLRKMTDIELSAVGVFVDNIVTEMPSER